VGSIDDIISFTSFAHIDSQLHRLLPVFLSVIFLAAPVRT
jgi:hypothetical protein